MTDEEIKKGLDKAYKDAGKNAYFGNGFEAGVRFAQQQINKNDCLIDINESYLKTEIERHISKKKYQLDEIIEHGIGDSDANKTKWMLEKDIEIFSLFLNSR